LKGKDMDYRLIKHRLAKTKFLIPWLPRGLRATLYGPKALANSIPKSGTHLLAQLLFLLGFHRPLLTKQIENNTPQLLQKLRNLRKGQYITGHLYWSQALVNELNNVGIRILFIIRDLRDIACSHFYYVTYMDCNHRLHRYYNCLKSDNERLMASIAGIDGKLLPGSRRWEPIGERAKTFLPWLDESTCLVVRFEDLVGSLGGGNDEKQIETIQAIVNHLGVRFSKNQIVSIANKVFSRSSVTFRKGKIGDWRIHFTDEHKKAFKKTAGDILVRLGYATDYDW